MNGRAVCHAASLQVPLAPGGAFVHPGGGNEHGLVGVGYCRCSSDPRQSLWSCFVLHPGRFPGENTALERRMPGIEWKGKEDKFCVGVLQKRLSSRASLVFSEGLQRGVEAKTVDAFAVAEGTPEP